jgi:hypothetical protein
METIVIIVAVVVIAGLIYYNRANKSLDINQDGKVNVKDVKIAVKTAAAGVKADVGSARVAVKKAAVKAKAARKPRAPKAQ